MKRWLDIIPEAEEVSDLFLAGLGGYPFDVNGGGHVGCWIASRFFF